MYMTYYVHQLVAQVFWVYFQVDIYIALSLSKKCRHMQNHQSAYEQ